ncbi:MAG: hypothetical protein HPY50_19285 [Firmicutes bacterium]|nr:hypothetical protein [Bacillota bacterium]
MSIKNHTTPKGRIQSHQGRAILCGVLSPGIPVAVLPTVQADMQKGVGKKQNVHPCTLLSRDLLSLAPFCRSTFTGQKYAPRHKGLMPPQSMSTI